MAHVHNIVVQAALGRREILVPSIGATGIAGGATGCAADCGAAGADCSTSGLPAGGLASGMVLVSITSSAGGCDTPWYWLGCSVCCAHKAIEVAASKPSTKTDNFVRLIIAEYSFGSNVLRKLL